MSLSFFTPNSSNTGGAVHINVVPEIGNFYFTFQKQTGWNSETKKGEFKGGETINVKFNDMEMGEFLSVMEEKGEYSFYHGFDDAVTTGRFNYFCKQRNGEDGKALKPLQRFLLAVKKGDKEFRVSLTLGAAARLKSFLATGLNLINLELIKEEAARSKKAKAEKKHPVENAPEKGSGESDFEIPNENGGSNVEDAPW